MRSNTRRSASASAMLFLALLVAATTVSSIRAQQEVFCPNDFLVFKRIDNSANNDNYVTEGQRVRERYLQTIIEAETTTTTTTTSVVLLGETETTTQKALEPKPIQIVRQSGDFVEFNIHRNTTWYDPESQQQPAHVFVEMGAGRFVSEKCVLYDDDDNNNNNEETETDTEKVAAAEESNTNTPLRASCVSTSKGGKIALVRTFARYAVEAPPTKSAAIPRCCMDPYKTDTNTNTNTTTTTNEQHYKVIEYVFEVRCSASCDDPENYSGVIVPTQLPTTTTTTLSPTVTRTDSPVTVPVTDPPTITATDAPTKTPTESPTITATDAPTKTPTESPTITATDAPTKTPTESPTITATDAPTTTAPVADETCPTTNNDKPVSSLSRDLVVGSQYNGPHWGSRHRWAWPGMRDSGCGRYGNIDQVGGYALPCYVNTQMVNKGRVLNFDSGYMNFKLALDDGMKSTVTLASSSSSVNSKGPTALSFYPTGTASSQACTAPPASDDHTNYPVRLVRSGRYLHHWYFEKVTCDGVQTRVELKVTPDCVELYSVSAEGAKGLNWLDSDSGKTIVGSTNGYAGISYCVQCDSEVESTGSGSGNNDDQPLSGCAIVETPIRKDCCGLSPTNLKDGDRLCGSGWDYQTCPQSKLIDTELTRDVTITSAHPVVGTGHSFEIRVPRGSGGATSNVFAKFDIVNNNPNTWKKVKINFHIDSPRRHTGAAGILRDPNTQEPTGIHVQMSKNWHVTRSVLYAGYWWTGTAHVRVPPGKTSLEFVCAYQYYKALHGVSHSQLSLLGWGVNGLWEEVGIGANGESITYEPHGHHRRQMILDTRPWLVCQMNADGCRGTVDNTQWTENHGGGDFLVAVDTNGMYQYLVGDTSFHTMNGPRLTNATYEGTTVDQNIAVSRTVSTWTADDFVRHLHSFRYTFLNEVPGDRYPRFALYTLGGDNYNYIRFPLFAYGMGSTNGFVDLAAAAAAEGIPTTTTTGVVPIKDVIAGVTDFKYTEYYRVDAPIGCGQYDDENNKNNGSCWFAMMTNPTDQVHHRANRGIVVRNFHGRLNGEAWPPVVADEGGNRRMVSPFAFHLIKSRQNNAARDTVSIELALPTEFTDAVAAGTAKFLVGDYISADIEVLLPPRQTGDYFGNSRVLKQWLSDAGVDDHYENGWKVISREASVGDGIQTIVFDGTTLERLYHPRVRVDCTTDTALFNIAFPLADTGGTGGTGDGEEAETEPALPGILPITIAGVNSGQAFSENLLDRPSRTLWRYIDSTESWEAMGTNGSYQLEKDVRDGSYTYVYSLQLEFETNPVGKCERFSFSGEPPTVANPPC